MLVILPAKKRSDNSDVKCRKTSICSNCEQGLEEENASSIRFSKPAYVVCRAQSKREINLAQSVIITSCRR